MLDQRCQTNVKTGESVKLGLKIELTRELRAALEEERGVVDPNLFEARRSARFRCHGAATACLLESRFEFENQEKEAIVIVRDISRTGLGLISHQQWYPAQLLRVELDHAVVECRVARARRVGPRCYEIGTTISKYTKNE